MNKKEIGEKKSKIDPEKKRQFYIDILSNDFLGKQRVLSF